jgi:hypothetical protein
VSYFILEDFRLGQDSRKSPLTAAPGTLTTLINGHITRGGELEKRRALVSTYTLPAGTFGLGAVGGQLYVFGSEADPGVPAGLLYQRLEHPTGEAMTQVLDVNIFNSKLYVVAKFADASIQHFYDGTRIDDFTDGKARGRFNITGGSVGAGVNKITSVKVNGVEILNTAVDWTTDNATTAAAVAVQITSYSSTPDYTASASGVTVVIEAPTAGTSFNGFPVVVTTAGDVTSSTPSAMADGIDETIAPGRVAVTFGTKVYTISDSSLVFSAVNDPTDYNDATGIGAGTINMSNHSAGSEVLTALRVFYDKLAIFAEEAVQIWFVEADDANNTQAQVIQNTGTNASRSVAAFGDGDVFYLARNGVRALKARDTNNVATVSEVGTAIDTDIIEFLATLTDDQIANAVATVEPIDKRYWLAIGDRVYVYSYFSGSKIAAWSTYEFGVSITDFAVLADRVYARAGDTVYLYGGEDNDTYDSSTVEFVVPYMDAKTPGNPKTLNAIDTVAEGTWSVQMCCNPKRSTEFDDLGTFTGSTLDTLANPAQGKSTYFAFKFTHEKPEYARFSRFVMYFEKDEAKA